MSRKVRMTEKDYGELLQKIAGNKNPELMPLHHLWVKIETYSTYKWFEAYRRAETPLEAANAFFDTLPRDQRPTEHEFVGVEGQRLVWRFELGCYVFTVYVLTKEEFG